MARHRSGDLLRKEDDSLSFTGHPGVWHHPAAFDVAIHTAQSLRFQEEAAQSAQTAAYAAFQAQVAQTVVDDALAARLNWQYPQAAFTKLPTKLSISEIKRLYQTEQQGWEGESLLAPDPTVKWPAFYQPSEASIAGARLGALIHTVMERLDVHVHTTTAHVQELVARLTAQGVFTPEEGAAIPVGKIGTFAASPLAERMRRAVAIHKETPFVMRLSERDMPGLGALLPPEGSVLFHGIIDCFFEETTPNGETRLVLVDYKSDKVRDVAALKERYALQLALYKMALEKCRGAKVAECLLYLFALDGVVEV